MNKTLLTSVLTMAILPLGAICTTCERQDHGPPNIVIFLVDDLGISDLGCYGNHFNETPNIDRLADLGIRYSDAYATCPVCSPSRASLMTGKYPVRVDITDFIPGRQFSRGLEADKMLKVPSFSHQLALGETTLAELVKKAGYAAGFAGKWHLGAKGFYPTDQGFDVDIAGDKRGMPPSYYAPYLKQPQQDTTPFTEFSERSRENQYLTDQLTSEAISFVREHAGSPFLLYLSFYNVHIPVEGRGDLVKKYQAKLAADSSYLHKNVHYAAMVEAVDENIGKVMNILDSLKISHNTIVIFTSDNGGLSVKEGPRTPSTTNSPYRAGKGYIYEGGIREPFIVYWPKGIGTKGVVSHTPVIGCDVFPTIAELLGQDAGDVDGISLLPQIKYSKDLPERALYWHYPHYSNQGGTPASAIRLGRYKLIQFLEDNHYELYDLVADRTETKDIATDMPDKVDELAAMLSEWRLTNGAHMPVPNPVYDPNK